MIFKNLESERTALFSLKCCFKLKKEDLFSLIETFLQPYLSLEGVSKEFSTFKLSKIFFFLPNRVRIF
jgi:hypothetical protein